MTGKDLKMMLQSGKRIYGTAIISNSPLWPSVVKQGRLDFVFLDTEHIPLDRNTLAAMCQIYSALDLPSIVRITKPDPYEACAVLDGGAAGIIAPYVETAEQVLALVGACKFRPLKGEKLEKALKKPDTLEPELRSYLANRNENNMLFINIESVPALKRLDDILAVKGLDGVIIGPHDLSCSLGVAEQYTHPEFEEAVRYIAAKVRQADLAIGIHFSETADFQVKWANEGINIILQSSDISIFAKALKEEIGSIRRQLGDNLPEKNETSGHAI